MTSQLQLESGREAAPPGPNENLNATIIYPNGATLLCTVSTGNTPDLTTVTCAGIPLPRITQPGTATHPTERDQPTRSAHPTQPRGLTGTPLLEPSPAS